MEREQRKEVGERGFGVGWGRSELEETLEGKRPYLVTPVPFFRK